MCQSFDTLIQQLGPNVVGSQTCMHKDRNMDTYSFQQICKTMCIDGSVIYNLFAYQCSCLLHQFIDLSVRSTVALVRCSLCTTIITVWWLMNYPLLLWLINVNQIKKKGKCIISGILLKKEEQNFRQFGKYRDKVTTIRRWNYINGHWECSHALRIKRKCN